MADQVEIPTRFRGPPDSANGGYTCGLVAAAIEPDPAVEVTLRRPPPLERPMELANTDDGAELRDGETLIASGHAAPDPGLEFPQPVSEDDAAAALRGSPLHDHHPFSGCFVCGPDRDRDDGLRIVCGPVPGREGELVAAPWETAEWMAAADGSVAPELVWSALDCPSGLAAIIVPDLGVTVLGRLTAVLSAPIEAGSTCVAIGWPIERDGRKLHTASAILGADGQPLAHARAVWIEISQEPGYGGKGGD